MNNGLIVLHFVQRKQQYSRRTFKVFAEATDVHRTSPLAKSQSTADPKIVSGFVKPDSELRGYVVVARIPFRFLVIRLTMFIILLHHRLYTRITFHSLPIPPNKEHKNPLDSHTLSSSHTSTILDPSHAVFLIEYTKQVMPQAPTSAKK